MGLPKYQNSGPASPASHLTIHARCSVHNLEEGRRPSLPLQRACLPSHSDLAKSPLLFSSSCSSTVSDFEVLPARVHVSTGISVVLPLVPPHRRLKTELHTQSHCAVCESWAKAAGSLSFRCDTGRCPLIGKTLLPPDFLLRLGPVTSHHNLRHRGQHRPDLGWWKPPKIAPQHWNDHGWSPSWLAPSLGIMFSNKNLKVAAFPLR